MKTNCILFILFVAFAASCTPTHSHKAEAHTESEEHELAETVELSEAQFEALDMHIDTIAMRKMGVIVETNGELEVSPQNEAAVTTSVGANVERIQVIEGEKVKKGQVLAYLEHPDLIALQTDYMKAWHELQYIENEYERQKKLYDEKIGSGKDFQKIKSEYFAAKASVRGYEAQLSQLGLNIQRLREGDIYESIPLVSPMSGYVRLVEVKTGEYAAPEDVIFWLINLDHIHADFMVYEKDIRKVKKGQEIQFTIESRPDEVFSAKIYSVGKVFEQNPKAVHIHAEIENKADFLLPGMYVRGKIFGESEKVTALPVEAIVTENGRSFIYTVEADTSNGADKWVFERTEIRTGKTADEWTEVKLLTPPKKGTKVAWNNAYYLEAELKKGETTHAH